MPSVVNRVDAFVIQIVSSNAQRTHTFGHHFS